MNDMELMDQVKLQRVIDSLNNAISMCNKVDYSVDGSLVENIEKTAPHAVGYSKSTMMYAVRDLENVLKTYC
jgi:hypothetical protein